MVFWDFVEGGKKIKIILDKKRALGKFNIYLYEVKILLFDFIFYIFSPLPNNKPIKRY